MAVIDGTSSSETLNGSTEDDLLEGGAGNDSLIGGAGLDTALYSGNFSDYSFGYSTDSIQVTDLRTGDGDEGTDFLRGIEHLQFADRTLN